jgi:hypothetical protein
MLEQSARDPALDFFYFGFFQALRRFRFFTMTGWLLAGAGVGAIALRWGPVWSGDPVSIVLCGLLFTGGIVIVQASIAALGSYVRIPFPPPPPGSADMEHLQAVEEILPLLKEVDEGGWQEAFRAMVSLREIGSRHGLPPPDNFPV